LASEVVANELPSQIERHVMHLELLPILASGLWIGGGSVGLILLIIIIVLVLRR
jgi:hypothetical protein